jgi:hypothetical protein
MAALAVALGPAAAAARADGGLTAPRSIPVSAAEVTGVGVDAARRVYAFGGDGSVAVRSPSGAVLADWPTGMTGLTRRAVLPDGGVVAVATSGGALTRWTWDGKVVSQWSLPSGPVISLTADPRGSLLVRTADSQAGRSVRRVSLDGGLLGWVPGGDGDPAVAATGREWIAGSAVVASFAPDGLPGALLGHDCPIGGDGPVCTPGIFSPAGGPLSLAAIADGGVLVADPGTGAVHGFSASGGLRFSCEAFLGSNGPVRAVASDGNDVILASATAVYRSTIAGTSSSCAPPRVRISNLRVRGRALSFTLSRAATVATVLRRVAGADCMTAGFAPVPAKPGCITVDRVKSLAPRRARKGRNTIKLPKLPSGGWVANAQLDDGGVQLTTRFTTGRR